MRLELGCEKNKSRDLTDFVGKLQLKEEECIQLKKEIGETKAQL